MSGNPMREARAVLVLHPRCGAHARTTGEPCKAPAMANGRCRMHGGMSPGGPTGERNGAYKHGRQTKEAIARRRAGRALLRELLRLLADPEGHDDD
jgi:hypothetical protein